jgi:hypothetical protein
VQASERQRIAGPETTIGTLSGGGGGTSGAVSCASGTVAVGAGVGYGTYVSEFGGSTVTERGAYVGQSVTPATWTKEYCEASTQPARAIRGRSGGYVDAIGAICNEP